MPTPPPRPSSSAGPAADAAVEFLFAAVAGPATGAEVGVPAGRPLTVGRMAGNGMVVERDDSLSRRHFQLLYEGGELYIEDLGSSYGTFLNEERLPPGQPRPLHPEVVVRAGESQFVLHPAPAARAVVRPIPRAPTHGSPAAPVPPIRPSSRSGADAETDSHVGMETEPPTGDADGALDVPIGPLGFRDESVSQTCARAGLESGFARVGDGPETVLAQLAELDPEEALRFLAAALPPRAAVRWATECVNSVISPSGDAVGQKDADALAAAAAWADDPSEANRRVCEAAAEALGHQTAAAWCAMAAFCSHGSLGPPATAVVPAPPTLATTAVHAAVTLAAVADPAAADQRRLAFLERRPAADAPPSASGGPDAPGPSGAAPGGGRRRPEPPRRPGGVPASPGSPAPPKPPPPPKPPA